MTKVSRKQPTKIDWNAAKQDYLSDATTSYRKIAEKYGVSSTAVEERGTKEGWAKTRKELGKKAQEEWEKKLPEMQAEARSRHMMYSKNIQAIAAKLTMYIANGNYARDKQGNVIVDPNTGKPIQEPPNALEIRALAQTMKIALDMERVTLGMPNNVTGIGNPNGDDLGLSGLADLVAKAREANGDSPKE